MTVDPTMSRAVRNVEQTTDTLVVGTETIRLSRDATREVIRLLKVRQTDDGELIAWLRDRPLQETQEPLRCDHCGDRLTQRNGIPLPDAIGFEDVCRRCRGLSIWRSYAPNGHRLIRDREVCDICRRPEDAQVRGQTRALAVDHDHRTNELRGFLCGRCNVALGLFREDPAALAASIAYLADPPGIASAPL